MHTATWSLTSSLFPPITHCRRQIIFAERGNQTRTGIDIGFLNRIRHATLLDPRASQNEFSFLERGKKAICRAKDCPFVNSGSGFDIRCRESSLELVFLFLGQRCLQNLDVLERLLQVVHHLVGSGLLHEQEERGVAGLNRAANLLDEFVVHTHIGQLADQRAGCSANDHAQPRHPEDDLSIVQVIIYSMAFCHETKMARKELNRRQFTIYTTTDGDIARWRSCCPKGTTLNRLIIEAVETFLEGETADQSTAQVKKLHHEIAELKKKNEELEKSNQDLLAAGKTRSSLHKPTIEYLRRDGIIKSPRNVPGQWAIVDMITDKYAHFDHIPDETDIKNFKHDLGYTSVRVQKIEDNTIWIRPSDQAGATDIASDIELQYNRAVRDTIEQLEELGLVECVRGGGYKWKR